MKNLKLNKLAENRLNEKEMCALIGGTPYKEWNYVCSIETGKCCQGMCSCTQIVYPLNVNTVSATGIGSITMARDLMPA